LEERLTDPGELLTVDPARRQGTSAVEVVGE